jgi:hypothetical protein
MDKFKFDDEMRPFTADEARAHLLIAAGRVSFDAGKAGCLAGAIRRSQFRWDDASVDVVVDADGRILRANGSSLCRARLLFPEAEEFPAVRFRTWMGRTPEEARRILAIFDGERATKFLAARAG